jgi:hypothetical protein
MDDYKERERLRDEQRRREERLRDIMEQRRGDNNEYVARDNDYAARDRDELRRKEERDRLLRDEYRKKFDLSGIPSNLNQDQAKAVGLKTEIETHILAKLSDYIISKHPRGNYTKTAYKIAIVNVLKNIFKDPNSDIITYIENKLKDEPEKKLGFFGFGGTKHRRKGRRKTRRT